MSARPGRVPEVVQTSELDCGPASLTALLRGLGLPVSYEAVRDVCATDVDGTSIDAMESVAASLGVDAEQMVVPAEHVFALPDEYLPAIVVTLLPDGFTHFVVAWARRGRVVEVMDPATGRRRVRVRRLTAELYRHRLVVPSSAWREWAGSAAFLDALRVRLRERGLEEGLAEIAAADPGPHSLARLDAALRAMTIARRSGASAFQEAYDDVGPFDRAALDERWSCVPVDDERVELQGAVIVRARMRLSEPQDLALHEVVTRAEPSALAAMDPVLSGVRGSAFVCATVGATLAAALVAEQLALAPLLGGRPDLHIRLASASVVIGVALAVCAQVLVSSQGRRADLAIRRYLHDGVGLLADRWVRTRPTSDLVERAHQVHRVRELPGHVLEAALVLGVIIVATLAAAVRAPSAIPALLALVTVSCGGPLVFARAASERDLRVRTLSGTLAGSVQDGLLGAEARWAAGFAPMLDAAHERVLGAWRRTSAEVVLHATLARAAVAVAGAACGVAALQQARGDGPSEAAVAVAFLAASVLDSGGRLADLLRSLPLHRSTVLRLANSVGAIPLHAGAEHVITSPPTVRLEAVEVRVGSASVLECAILEVPAGAHVAVVGPSGAGKSTLATLVLGLQEVMAGQVLLDGHVVRGPVRGAVWISPEVRLWNRDLRANVLYGVPPGSSFEEALAWADADALGRLRDNGARLGEAARTLSDGEAQRVRIARGHAHADAPLVVLDEAFRGLERGQRRRLLARCRERWDHATMLCITHDIEDTLQFDLVVVVEGGAVVEVGTPASLADRVDGHYRALLDADVPDSFAGWASVVLGGIDAVA